MGVVEIDNEVEKRIELIIAEYADRRR